MDSKSKHPFTIMCRKCGSNNVQVRAYDYYSLEISCRSCGFCLDCGMYATTEGDYRNE